MSEQEALELEILVDRRDSFAAAFEFWKSQIGGPDEAALSNDAGNPVMAMLLCADQWRRLTAAVDRRLARLPGRLL